MELGQEQGTGLGLMGLNILYRNMHTGLNRKRNQNLLFSIVLVQFPVPVPVPVPCSVNKSLWMNFKCGSYLLHTGNLLPNTKWNPWGTDDTCVAPCPEPPGSNSVCPNTSYPAPEVHWRNTRGSRSFWWCTVRLSSCRRKRSPWRWSHRHRTWRWTFLADSNRVCLQKQNDE